MRRSTRKETVMKPDVIDFDYVLRFAVPGGIYSD